MRISENTINTIREQVDIVDVVSNYLTLKRTGSNYRALCPFHDEKTPSFFVSPAKQIFHCFGCGKGGDLIKFVSEIEGINYYEAAIKIAKEYNIPVEYEGTSFYLDYLKLNELIADYFHKNLLNNLNSEEIKNFLKKREITKDLIDKFYLGYAKNGNDLVKFLKNRAIDMSKAVTLGLIKEGDNDYYDYFRNRIIFPIRNLNGEIIGFGGRVLNDKDSPKYLNSPDTPVYNKKNSLYGIFENRENIKKIKEVIFVEGYMDLISLYKYGIRNCVATCGTALTENQIKFISRFTDNLYFFYDGDKAGIKASVRGAVLCINQNIYPKIISLPENIDPDDFIKKYGSEKFNELKKEAKELVEFMYEKIKPLDLNQLEIKLKVVKKIQNIYFDIDNPIYKKHFVKKFAEFLNLKEKELENFLNKFFKIRKIYKNESEIPERKVIKLTNEDKLVAFILQNFEEFDDCDIKYFENEQNVKILQKLKESKNVLSLQNDSNLDEEIKERIRIYLTYDFGLKDFKEKKKFYEDAILNLKRNFLKKEQEKLTKQLKSIEKDENFSSLYREILLKITKLKEEEKLLWS